MCNAQEQSVREELAKYKKATVNLSEQARRVKVSSQRVVELESELAKKSELVSTLQEKLRGESTTSKTHLRESVEADRALKRERSLTERLQKEVDSLRKSCS